MSVCRDRVPIGPAPLGSPLGRADHQVDSASQALEANWDLVAAIAFRHSYGLDIADGGLDTSGHVAHRGDLTKARPRYAEAVAFCVNTQDVVNAVEWAREQGIALRARDVYTP